ncbi:hypothetical protein, partial [Maribacter sp. 2308TA10-17]|uniref:hypothetical protein n=1 Tax=Maribacter sp. 2308TA10-17 TaxID=3386276 RepID=UPI0039BC3615
GSHHPFDLSTIFQVMSLPQTPSFQHHHHNRFHLCNKTKGRRGSLFLMLYFTTISGLGKAYKKEARQGPGLCRRPRTDVVILLSKKGDCGGTGGAYKMGIESTDPTGSVTKYNSRIRVKKTESKIQYQCLNI